MALPTKRILLLSYFAAVSVLSLVPGSGLPPVQLFPHADKLIHAFMYAGMAFLLFWNWPEYSSGKLRWLPLLIIIAFGLCIELLQEIPGIGRSFEWMDVLANSLGFFPGYGLYILLKRQLP